MKYGFMIIAFCIIMPSCCLRKDRKKAMPEESMMIEEEDVLMPTTQDETMMGDTSIGNAQDDMGMDVMDMATMQDEMTTEAE